MNTRVRWLLFLLLLLPAIRSTGQTPYEGPYLEAMVKYKFRINDTKEKAKWGLGFRMDTLGRRYVVIANDGLLTKSEFFFDSAGLITTEISTQLATGVKHVYDYYYEWLGTDTLRSIRSDYALTTHFIFRRERLIAVEKIYQGGPCKIINETPVANGEATPENVTCAEQLTYMYNGQGRVIARQFISVYSILFQKPTGLYLEMYNYNEKGLVDSVYISDNGKVIQMKFNYNRKGRIKSAVRLRKDPAHLETWKFKYKCNGLLRKVTYRDEGKKWVDKYRWKKRGVKKPYPTIPKISEFIKSHDLKLAEDFYFGY